MVSLYPKKDKIIKILSLFLVLTHLNGQIFPYLLPDQKDDFDHILITHIKKTHHAISILTPELHYPSLRRSLLQSLTKGVTLTLITQKASGDPLMLIAYSGVNWSLYTARPLEDTVILIDDTLVCHVAGGLHEESLSKKIQTPLCSDDQPLIQTLRHRIHYLQKHSRPYLDATP